MNEGFLSADIRDFYRDKNVIVLGGAGFVGQQLVRLLVLAQANVTVFDDFSRGSTKIPLATYHDHDVGSLIAADLLYVSMREADVVFNLAAAVAGVIHNQSNHLSMYYQNLRVLSVPVWTADDAEVPVFLQTSSVCVYAPEYNSPSDECCGMQGTPHPANAGYAEAKRDGERVALWAENIGRVVIVRPSNIAGPGDYFDELAHVIPAFVERAFYNNGEFVLYGDPSATREFIHPMDVANGMMYAAAFGKHREAYNIGTNGDTTISMQGLAELVLQKAELVSSTLRTSFTWPDLKTDVSKGGGDSRRWSNSAKLNALGWAGEIDLDTIVEQCVADFLAKHYPISPRAYA